MRKTPSVAVLAMLVAVDLHAGTPVTQSLRCPIGGTRFEFTTAASYNTWGARPDGKPYGSWTFPLPLPVCPGNGLVMYEEFSREQLRLLRPLTASPEYEAMSTTETPHYRAVWLMRKLGAPTSKVLWTLLKATWEADGNASQRARYQREYVELAKTDPRPVSGDDLDWIVAQARAANALRELGQFQDAAAMLQTIPAQSLDVPTGNRRGWLGYLQRLKAVIDRRETSAEPLDMIPPREAAPRCMATSDFSRPEVAAVCTSESVQREIAQLRGGQ
jgi:hypothetical protein